MFKYVKGTLILGAALAAAGAARAQSGSIPVYVNRDRLPGGAMMIRETGRTVLPMRVLFEALGAQVEWDPEERAVYAWKPDGNGVRLGLGEHLAQTLRMGADPRPGNWGRVIGEQRLDAPALMVGSRIYVPLRFAAEALRADVRYSSYEPAVHISTGQVAGRRGDEPPYDDRRDRRRNDEPPYDDRRDRRRDQPPYDDRRDNPNDRRNPPSGTMTPAQIAAALEVRLVLDDTRFSRGDNDVLIRVAVRNTGNRPVAVPFRSGQKFELEVLQDDHVVWNWARGRAFTQALSSMRLEPGDEQVLTARWNLRTNAGRDVEPGRYRIRAILTPSFRTPQLADEQSITVAR